MRPFYDAGGVTLYLGDALEVEAWRAGDVLVTDPPYGMGYVSEWVAKPDRHRPIAGDDTTDTRDAVLELWGGRPALVFGRWDQPRPAGTRHRLVWDKRSPGMGDLKMPWGPGDEEIYVIGEGWAGVRVSNVIACPTEHPSSIARRHPTPKPVALLEALVERCPAGVIVDPFAGSGSTLLAARALGRQAIGVELDEAYCELIATRLEATPPALWAA